DWRAESDGRFVAGRGATPAPAIHQTGLMGKRDRLALRVLGGESLAPGLRLSCRPAVMALRRSVDVRAADCVGDDRHKGVGRRARSASDGTAARVNAARAPGDMADGVTTPRASRSRAGQ